MGVAESRIVFVWICVFSCKNKENYCTFADKNMALSHISIKY